MKTLAASIVIAISLVSTAFAQQGNPTSASLEGVWKVTKVVQGGVVNTDPQPGLLIFTRGYYSATRVTAGEARKQSPAPKDPSRLTDGEKIAFYDEWVGYAASAGTYKIKGNTLSFQGVAPDGMDLFDATFTKGNVQCWIAPLTADGRIVWVGFARAIPRN